MPNRTAWLTSLLLTLFVCTATTDELSNKNKNTDIANEPDERLLLLSTLDGTLIGIEQQSGQIKWKIKDRPVVKVPTNTSDAIIPLFLPDPRDGSLYLLGGNKEPLKKLPFTIPQLVASSPCRSSDGILYTGKKKDVWFVLDPKTGQREQILGWGNMGPTCPVQSPDAVYIGRTQYSIMMVDSQNGNRKWNVSFYEYSATPMNKEMLAKYNLIHFASSSTGRIVTVDRRGSLIWDVTLTSPLVAAYIVDPQGLLVAPFSSVANHTLSYLATDILLQPNKLKLYPTLYIGEHVEGLYALPSLVDQNMVTITGSEAGPLLLEGTGSTATRMYVEFPVPGKNYKFTDNIHITDEITFQSMPIFLGHYNIPEFSNMRLLIAGRNYPQVKLITDERHTATREIYFDNNNNSEGEEKKQSIGVQTDMNDSHESENQRNNQNNHSHKSLYDEMKTWVNQQENKGLKLLFIILVGCVIAMFWYLKLQMREMQQLSQNGSRGSQPGSVGRHGVITATLEELDDGLVRVGKITFHPEELLGKGCEGTFVYRGEFDRRKVAVKRLLPECFTFADREVALLRESDAHPHVVRYFCTEQDRMFRYIALELCQATLNDYVQGNFKIASINALEILRQATAGLAHLHSLDIVHRDIKPQNVLLSMPNAKGEVRALISDFGLCKKLPIGKVSFSRRSGITGTEGWIAPEMMNSERTTCAVDMFSLGCVFSYVLSEGQHPFGDPLRRQANILNGESDFSSLKGEAWQNEIRVPLLKAMVSRKVYERPSCSAVLAHPIFWNNAHILAFLQDVSDRVEKAELDDPVLQALEKGGPPVVRGDWRYLIDEEVAKDLRKYRSYRGSSVRDLLRALRNKKHHFRELTEEAQKNLGEIPNEFTNYWTSRFPLLLVQAWLSMQCVAQEPAFKQYYHPTHRYELIDFAENEASAYLENVDVINVNVEEHFEKKKKDSNMKNNHRYNRSPKKFVRYDVNVSSIPESGGEGRTGTGTGTVQEEAIEPNKATGSPKKTYNNKKSTRFRYNNKKPDTVNWRLSQPSLNENFNNEKENFIAAGRDRVVDKKSM